MNLFLWALQALLAVHTLIGAMWKFSHTAEQTAPSLKAIPSGIWLALIAVELLCSVGLIVPWFQKPWATLAPIAAACIAVEMLFFSGVHLASGDANHSPMMYWLVVAAVCGFVVYGRLILKPM